MQIQKRANCRRVRDWLQEAHDREAALPRAPFASGTPDAPRAAGPSRFDRAAEAHLERCPRCRRFREFLSGYGRELAAALDELTRQTPLPDPAALEAGAGRARPARHEPADRAPARREPRERDRRHAAARWAVPAAAAALLLAVAAGFQAPRLVAGVRLERRVRAELAALVEELYAHPLAQGVEYSLAERTLWDGLSEEDGLQGLGPGEGASGLTGDFLSE